MTFLYIGWARERKKVRLVFEYSRKLFLIFISLVMKYWYRQNPNKFLPGSSPHLKRDESVMKCKEIRYRKMVCVRAASDRQRDGALCFCEHPHKMIGLSYPVKTGEWHIG